MIHFATKFAPAEEAVVRAKNAGFSAAEIWLDAACLEATDRILGMLQGQGLRYVLHFPNSGDLSDRHLNWFVEMYRGLDCQAAVIHKPMLRSYGKRLKKLSGDSLLLAVENGRQRGEDFRKWADDHSFLTMDVEHFWKYTLGDCPFETFAELLAEFFDEYGEKLRHIHMPGYLPGAPEHRPSYTNPQFACEVWDRLLESGFSGLAVSESNQEFQTDTHLRRDVILYQRWEEGNLEDGLTVQGEVTGEPNPSSERAMRG